MNTKKDKAMTRRASPGSHIWKACSEGILVGLFYLGLAILYTYPLILHLKTVYLGEGELREWLIYYWSMKQDLARAPGSSLEYLGRGFIPAIKAFFLAGHNPEIGNVLDLKLLSIPLERLFGNPLAYNLKALFILAANGLGGYYLIRHLSANRAVALAGGAIFTCNHYVFHQLTGGRLREAILFFIPLAILSLLHLAEKRNPAAALLAGGCCWLVAVNYWFYGLYLVYFGILYLVWLALVNRKILTRPAFWSNLGLAILIALALTMPFTYPYFDQLQHRGRLSEMTFFMPFPSYESITSGTPRPGIETGFENSLRNIVRDSWNWNYLITFDSRVHQSVPLVMILLAGAGLVLSFRSGLLWTLALAFFYLISLGPFAKGGIHAEVLLGPDGSVIRLPYVWLFEYVPIQARLFHPDRGVIWVYLALAVLAGLGLAAILKRLKLPAFTHWPISLGILALVIWHVVSPGPWPMPTSRLAAPAFYRNLAREPVCGIIEMPLGAAFEPVVNYYRTFHHCYLARGRRPGEEDIDPENPAWIFLAALGPAVPTGPPIAPPGGSGGPGPPPGAPHHGPGNISQPMPPPAQIASPPTDQAGRPLILPSTPLASPTPSSWRALAGQGYRYLVVHENIFRYYDPKQGAARYQSALAALTRTLGPPRVVDVEYTELVGAPPGSMTREGPSAFAVYLLPLGPKHESSEAKRVIP